MPLPLLLRSKYDKISKEEIAKSIEDDLAWLNTAYYLKSA